MISELLISLIIITLISKGTELQNTHFLQRTLCQNVRI
jgi:hypothetical protein